MTHRVVLTSIWWVWGALLTLAVVALSMQSALFGKDVAKVWQWFLPNLMPTLTMVGASAYSTTDGAQPARGGPAFILAAAASILYLLLLTVAVAATLFSAHPLDGLQQANIWLGPIQGLAASGLAVYFVKC